jgi:hypothetical protein
VKQVPANTPARQLGIDAGGIIAATQDSFAKVCLGQNEHGDIFIERPRPGHKVAQLKGHVLPALRSAAHRSLSCGAVIAVLDDVTKGLIRPAPAS